MPGFPVHNHHLKIYRDFPGGPVAKTPCSQCRGSGFHPCPEVSEIICTILPAFPYREGPELKLHSLGCICPPPPNLRTLDLGKAEGFFGSGSRIRIITLKMMGFPGGSAGKEPVCNGGDLGSIPGLGRSPGEGKDSPLQYSGLENSMDCIVHGVAKSRTQLTNFHSQTSALYTTPHSADGWV